MTRHRIARGVTIIALAASTLAVPAAFQQTTRQLEAALQAAIRTETIDGDLEGAIEQYEAIANGPDRALAAAALLRMAGAYEKFGEEKARETYQRIVDQFADQRTQAVEAQARLEAFGPAATGETTPAPGLKPLPGLARSAVGGGLDYRMSADGRYGIFTSYLYKGFDDVPFDSQNVGLFEYATRKVVWITAFPDSEEAQAEGLVFSPDGSRVAYSVARRQDGVTEVYVATLGEPARMIYQESNPDVLAETAPVPIWLSGWTPDDGLIGLRWIGGDWTSIVRLDVPTGRLDQITTFPPENGTPLPEVSPDGRTIAIIRPVDDHQEIHTYAVDGSFGKSLLTNNPADTSIGGPLWSRDGRHVLFTSNRSGAPGLWAVPVEDGRQAGPAFVVQPDFAGARLAWAGDSLSYYDTVQVNSVLTMSLDDSADELTGPLVRATYSPSARERHAVWSSEGDLAFLSIGGPGATLVIQQPDGRTRERPVPVELTSPQIIGFNVEGTAVAAYATSRHEQLALYDLETDTWSMVSVPTVRADWQKRLGYAAVQGDAGASVIYYPVTKRDPATRNYGPFEIHRLDATGRVATIYRSAETLGLGGRPLWLSADGRSLRFVDGLVYRELDLTTGTTRDLLTLDDSLAKSQQRDGPVSSADGTTVAVRLSADPSTLRVFDLGTGSSRDITVSRTALSEAMGPLPIEPDDVEIVEIMFARFGLSPGGDQIALDARVLSEGYRYVVDDPLVKVLRDAAGGR